MFKKAILALSLFPVLAFAVDQKPMIKLTDEVINKTYVCQKYNDNRIDNQYQFIGEDSGVLLAEQVIHQTQIGFKIDPNPVFKDGLVVDNKVGGSVTGIAGNSTVIFLKRTDMDNKTYFTVMISGPDEKGEGNINRVMYIADCERK